MNESVENGTFPDSLKEASLTPEYKSKQPFDKVNYRSVSILPFLLKVYKGWCTTTYRIIQKKTYEYTSTVL